MAQGKREQKAEQAESLWLTRMKHRYQREDPNAQSKTRAALVTYGTRLTMRIPPNGGLIDKRCVSSSPTRLTTAASTRYAGCYHICFSVSLYVYFVGIQGRILQWQG